MIILDGTLLNGVKKAGLSWRWKSKNPGDEEAFRVVTIENSEKDTDVTADQLA